MRILGEQRPDDGSRAKNQPHMCERSLTVAGRGRSDERDTLAHAFGSRCNKGGEKPPTTNHTTYTRSLSRSLARPGRQAAPSLSFSPSLSSWKQMIGTTRSLTGCIQRILLRTYVTEVRNKSQDIIRSAKNRATELNQALDGTLESLATRRGILGREREKKKRGCIASREPVYNRPAPAARALPWKPTGPRVRGREPTTLPGRRGVYLSPVERVRARSTRGACADHLPAQFFSIYLSSRTRS